MLSIYKTIHEGRKSQVLCLTITEGHFSPYYQYLIATIESDSKQKYVISKLDGTGGKRARPRQIYNLKTRFVWNGFGFRIMEVSLIHEMMIWCLFCDLSAAVTIVECKTMNF